jgi:YD repeat-containing protein
MLMAMLGVVTPNVATATTYHYDALGRLVRVIHDDGKVTDYALDPAGNRTTVATAVGNFGTVQPAFRPAALGAHRY